MIFSLENDLHLSMTALAVKDSPSLRPTETARLRLISESNDFVQPTD